MPINFDWNTGPLAKGLHCYRTRQFFEAHEHWEAVWLTLAEPEKSFLQALVQVSAAFHHLQRGNRTGAISLLTRSLRRLERSPSEFCGVDVGKIFDQARNWLTVLESSSIEMPPDYPVIEICDQNRATSD